MSTRRGTQSEWKKISISLPLGASARIEKRRSEAEVEFLRRFQGIIADKDKDSSIREMERLLIQYAHKVFNAAAEEAINSPSSTWIVSRCLEAYLLHVIGRGFPKAKCSAAT